MTDTVTAALIGVGGSVIVAVVSVRTQLRVTKAVIQAERKKVGQQLLGEEASRVRETRREQIRETISGLLAASDPQIVPGGDYDRAVSLIHRAYLLLDSDKPEEATLSRALNQLGLQLQEYIAVRRRSIDDKIPETQRLLVAQGVVADQTRTVLKSWSVAAT